MKVALNNNSIYFNKNIYSNSYEPKNTANKLPDKNDAELQRKKYAHIPSSYFVSFGKKTELPHITEKDINIAVTCIGHDNIKGNARDVFDFRCPMQSVYGIDWSKNFHNPHIIRNGNLDEKINGETTALVIPLHPHSGGIRRADNMTLLINGNIPKEILDELIIYMTKAGILNDLPLYNVRYYVNSTEPKEFMSNPKIKTIIANFFRKKEIEQIKFSSATESVNKGLKTSDINIVNIDRKVDSNNSREIKDYLRDFLRNGKKFTVIYDKYSENNNQKDMTVLLIPSTKSDWDFITVTIDKKISEDKCKDLINHLVKNKMANVENPTFKNAIVEYVNRNNL